MDEVFAYDVLPLAGLSGADSYDRDGWLAGGAERKMGGREKDTQTDSSVAADKQSGRQGLRKATRKRLGSRV